MEDIVLLMRFLNNQDKGVVKKLDWDDVTKFTLNKEGINTPGHFTLDIPSVHLIFHFDENGKFHGICNYKE